MIGWDLDDGYMPCSFEVTSANWYKEFRLNVRATADNLVETDMMRTISITYMKLVEGAEPVLLLNSTEITVLICSVYLF